MFLLAQLVVLAACNPQSGGQTGEDSSLPCRNFISSLPSIDAVSPLGFSASQVLSFAAVKHESTLAWHAIHNVISNYDHDSDVSTVGYSPGPGETGVAFTIIYTNGGIQFIHHEPNWPDAAKECPDSLVIDVTASLVTSDGALDESFATSLYADSLQQADWGAEIPWSEIKGSFRVATYPPDFSQGLPLSGSVTPLDTVGHVGEPVMRGVRADQHVSFADWPAGTDCDGYVLPLDIQIQQVSGNDVIALINNSPPIPEMTGDKVLSSLKLRVSPDGQTACVRNSSKAQGDVTINTRAHLNATTDDSSLSTDLPINIEALQNTIGGLSWITVAVDSPYDTGVSPSDLFARLGYPATDLSGYDMASCSFNVWFWYNVYQMGPTSPVTKIEATLQARLYTGATCAQDISNAGCVGEIFEARGWGIEF